MSGEREWPERAWWSVVLVDMLSIFVIVVVWLTCGWGVAAFIGVVATALGLWWQVGPFWTRDQRERIRRQARQRIDRQQG
ncbi:hypothetical protein ACH9EU_05670 [Kocuria sp. M1R5S2]|uniref:hypothetical protein n=1 Tax=Kocuria rhizosphaerae TaxID=3376285 RepID=UPI0037935CFD